ncbi:hypothetical protein F53441_13000 [Fusarium austroafricanum]|uniref:Uncharacterized protein n=1 Tax=Fusarium austroafricanum TaxID=2364996 RepID=A0A8H4JU37_9HYPO|nr:hypothetical protein F53441_13000 [Fusarium austroafricanum]
MLNSEIDNKIRKRKLKPKLYKEEAVQTLQMKVDRAGKRCLGGIMVWAISHDTKEARYNKALADILGREWSSGSLDDDEKAVETKKILYEQCRWINCKEFCPKGWVHVGRTDKYARKDKLMYDETGCGGDGSHHFCCPPDEDIPQCGWYNYGNACCTTKSESMKVYGDCTWGAYPECNSKPECPLGYYDTPVARSGAGSGGLQCNNLKNDIGNNILGVHMRNYCCGTEKDLQFTDCQVYRNAGAMIKGYSQGTCRSNCLSDRVRVAIDWPFQACSIYPVGGQATCCKTTYGKEKDEPNEQLEAYRQGLDEWLADKYCPNPYKVLKKRDLSSSSTELAVRADKVGDMSPRELLTNILGLVGSQVMLAEMRLIWNNAIRRRYYYLQITYMSNYIRNNWRYDWEGPSAFARNVLCYPNTWAARIEAFLKGDKDSNVLFLNCSNPSLCYSDGNCGEAGDNGNKRRHAALFGRHSNHFPTSSHHQRHHQHHHRSSHVLERREVHTIEIKDEKGKKHKFDIHIPPYPDLSRVPQNNSLLKRLAQIRFRGPCEETAVILRNYYHTRDFALPNGERSTYGPIPIEIWTFMEHASLGSLPNAPGVPGGRELEEDRVFERAYECLGSISNDQVFMIADIDINAAKNYVRLNKIVKDAYVQFKFAEDVYNARNPNKPKVQLANHWLEWITNYYRKVVSKLKENIMKAMNQIDEVMEDENISQGKKGEWIEIQAQYQLLADDADLMRIDTSGFPDFNSPITEPEDIEDDPDTEMRDD